MEVLIIGGSGVVGRGVAKGMANAEGVSKGILTAKNKLDKAQEVAREIGGKVEVVPLNVEE